MRTGLRIKATEIGSETVVFETVVPAFPVRFGRSSTCEVRLQQSFVSGTHAVVDLKDGKLQLRDMGSRNKIRLGEDERPLDANAEVDLRTCGFQFSIGTLKFLLAEVEIEPTSDDAVSIITGKPSFATVVRPDAGALARSAEAEALASSLEAPFAAYRREWSRFREVLEQHLATMSPSLRPGVLVYVRARFPAACNEPEFQRLFASYAPTPPAAPPPRVNERNADAPAVLFEIQKLATYFLDLPIETMDDAARFCARIRDTLAAFLMSVVPLRDGIRVIASQLGSQASTPVDTLDFAKTGAEVADVLLNWKNTTDAKLAVDQFFKRAQIHQIGLISGVMRGVQVLLEELSPTKIRAYYEQGGARRWGAPASPASRKVWPWSYRALWDAFADRHRDLASEESGYFRVIFGPEFDYVYRSQDLEAVAEPAPGEDQPPPDGPTGTVIVAPGPVWSSPEPPGGISPFPPPLSPLLPPLASFVPSYTQPAELAQEAPPSPVVVPKRPSVEPRVLQYPTGSGRKADKG